MRMPTTPAITPGSRRVANDSRPIAGSLNLPHQHVELIDQSHQRCLALGVSRIERPDLTPLARPDLTVARERNLRLYDHAAPVMELLFEQIVNTESMVALTDATGTVLHSIGDDDFLGRAQKVALAPGANWSEAAKGTNAVGTTLIEELPVLVHADEHFLHANHFLTCSAAPILDPRGNILGALDVSGDHRSYHQHTMALVKMSARMIENRWLNDDYRNLMRLHFHSRAEFIGTLMEGILAIAADGRIMGANRGALEQLGISGAAVRMQSLTTLFGTTVGALVDRFRSPMATPVSGRLRDGRPFHLLARFNWPVWSSLAEAMGRAAPTHADPAAAPPSPFTPPGHGAQTSAADRTDLLPDASLAARQPAGFAGPVSLSDAGDDPGPVGGSTLAELRTGDPQVASVVEKIRRVLDRDIPILILGDSGTGKEFLARAIHIDSARAKQPFVAVHGAATPASEIEAELFGCDEGSAGGARRKGQVGKIVQADGGTLFLDEVGELPLALQARLLRVLQERQVTPLGSSRHVAVDVSIICASRHNLRAMIEAGTFRDDLFYRLNGLAVRLPPLRERSDRMALIRQIVERERQGRALPFAPDVVPLLEHYPWPGNLRQLFNVLRTACVMAAHEALITRDHLSDDFLEEATRCLPDAAGKLGPTHSAGHAPTPTPTAAPDPAGHAAAPAHGPPLQRTLGAMEIDAIRQAVAACGGNISEASKRLGISRNTIYRKLRWR
jgi:sigma-54 dependent transcriptional regulator, acetoin dehydrogenase operon transcriptional activator AcoR